MGGSLRRELDFAAEVAREAGARTLKYFRAGVQPSWKQDATPVTIADVEAEDLIRERLRREYPADGLVGEERGEQPGTSGRRWIIDPIDGTKSFIQGVPLYAVLIALEIGADPLVGAVYLPALDELAVAARGEGCFFNGDPAAVSTVSELREACFVYTSFRNFETAGERGAGARARLAAACRVMRGWGDAYGYVLVATGRAEAMFDPIINPWDIAPMKPLVEEAGGRLTDWNGKPSIRSGHCVAANGKLHEEVLGLLR